MFDLAPAIDRRHPGVALDDAFARCHFRRLVVRQIALNDLALRPAPLLGVVLEPLAHLRGVFVQSFEPFCFFLGYVRLNGFVIGVAVAREHLLDLHLDLVGLPLELGPGAAPGFAGVTGQLDSIDGEHLAPDESLRIAQEQHLGEEIGDLVLHIPNEAGNGGEVRGAVSGQRYEHHVLPARLLNRAAAHDAARVGKQHHFEQHGGRIGRRAGFVVMEPIIQGAQIEFVVDQVIQGMFKRAGNQLAGKINGQQFQTGIDSLVAGHRALHFRKISMPKSCSMPMTGAISQETFSTTSLAVMIKAFLACLTLLVLSVAGAQERATPDQLEQWMAYYYLAPHPEEVASALEAVTAKGFFENDNVQAPLSGFFTEIFRANPDKVGGWVKPYVGIPNRHILYSALWMANSKESRTALEQMAHGAAPEEAKTLRGLASSPPPTVESMTIDSPASLDYMWGYFLASGSDKPVLRVIDQMKLANTKGNVSAMLIGGAAQWSVSANARQHEKVLKIVKANAETADPETKALLKEILAGIDAGKAKK